MISCSIGIFFFTVFVLVATHGVPGHVCPRHRGLPDGFKRGDNSILNRALYRIDLRHALKGYKPNQVYRFRVHTTARKFKFNDATFLVEALNPLCGAGTLLVQDDSLYSPQGCPDVVTTQQKEPMGRAHFRWQAPSCGCVHIRSRVHANASYFLENEDVHNGPLARTVCPKDDFLKHTSEYQETLKNKERIAKLKRSREYRLDKLCEANKQSDSEKVLKDEAFLGRRHVRITNDFDLDRLTISLEQRRARTMECCNMVGRKKMDCFGDVRRRRIDTFCGTGEPEVPFSKSKFDWIKQRESDCCWQIGEDRYTCFNYTDYRAGRPMEQTPEGKDKELDDLDDFDPANDLEDFITSDEAFLKDTSSTVKTNDKRQPDKTTPHLSAMHERQLKSNTSQKSSQDKEYSEATSSDYKETPSIKSAIVNNENGTKTRNVSEIGAKDNEEESSKEDIDEEEEEDDDDEINDDDNDNDNDNDDDDDDEDDDAYEEKKKQVEEKNNGDKRINEDMETADDSHDSEEDRTTRSRLDINRRFTDDECCLKGMTAGTIISAQGWDGCFKIADKLNTVFNKWNKRCDRLFVTCCMRAMDGKSISNFVLQKTGVFSSSKSLSQTTNTPRSRYTFYSTKTLLKLIIHLNCNDLSIHENKRMCQSLLIKRLSKDYQASSHEREDESRPNFKFLISKTLHKLKLEHKSHKPYNQNVLKIKTTKSSNSHKIREKNMINATLNSAQFHKFSTQYHHKEENNRLNELNSIYWNKSTR